MGELQLTIEPPREAPRHIPVARPRPVGFRDAVMGYNHQIPHRGRIFHVQSEDSGPGKRHIFTHVFHSGTIVASNRIDYAEATSATDISDLLKKSQKSMLLRLVRGLLDDGIARCLGTRAPSPKPRALPAAPRPALAVVPDAAEEPPPSGSTDDEVPARYRALLDSVDLEALDGALHGLEEQIPGVLGVALVDCESGMCIGTAGTGVDLTRAAAGNAAVMKAQVEVMRALGTESSLEDMLISLESQYHILRPINSALFLYLVIDRSQGTLGLARHKLGAAAAELRI